MRRLARVAVLGRWWVIGVTLAVLPLALLVGHDVAGDLSTGGFENPGSESTHTAERLIERFPFAGEPDFVVLVTAKSGDVDGDRVAAVGAALARRLEREPEVLEAGSYWSLGRPAPLKSRDGREALVIAGLRGDLDHRIAAAKRLSPVYTVDGETISTQITGTAEVARQVSARSEENLKRSEMLTAPVVFVALVLVFGSVVAALLPLGVGLFAVIGTMLSLTIIASLTEVSIFALNLTTGLGLGLAIDYSLFVVSRYREELEGGASRWVAVARTMQTAGRTVAFSAGTVMVSLLGLLVFPQAYLRSFAYAGVAVVGLAACGAIVVLPAVLAVLGDKVEKGRLFTPRPTSDGGFWARQARRVMRRPWTYALGVTAVLLVLAAPFLGITLGQIDDRVVPPGVSSARRATDQIRENFASRENSALRVYLGGVSPTRDAEQVDAFARRLVRLDGVARVDAATGFYFADGRVVPATGTPLSARFLSERYPDDTWVSVVPAIEPISKDGERLVREIRHTPAPFDFGVAGQSARFVDAKASVTDRLPWALGFIALVTFVLLFMMTGSLLVPVKALVLNLLSLTATFGAMVWIFQEGRFAGVLGYTPTGAIDTFTPILMFCIAFGLSMDYEVFLLSRIKEEYDLEHDNEHAVAVGLQKTGRIVTAAAVLLAIVFIGVGTSEVVQLKLFGIGLTLAVLVDAFLIRATLVPAFMRLAGRANWWAPRPLRRFHLRYGIWENEPIKILDRAFEHGG